MSRKPSLVGDTGIPKTALICWCVVGGVMWVGLAYSVGPAVRLCLRLVVSTANALGVR